MVLLFCTELLVLLLLLLPILLVLLCAYDLDKLANELRSGLAREDLLVVLFAVEIGECDDGVCEKEVVAERTTEELRLWKGLLGGRVEGRFNIGDIEGDSTIEMFSNGKKEKGKRNTINK